MSPIDFRNTNMIWASVLVETLARCGLQTAIVCPGSRSTPLTISLANHPDIEAIPILDERSASFFALGVAQRTGRATVLVCTSGTAGANFFPAAIEAHESRVPLLILTADRPPELRQCSSGQAIEQVRLYGNYPNWQTELAVPQRDLHLLRYLRQTIVRAWHHCHAPSPGIVHLNCPFRDPLPPLPEPSATEALQPEAFAEFFDRVTPFPACETNFANSDLDAIDNAIARWRQVERGAIVAGVATSLEPARYAARVKRIANALGWPILAEGLSPVRNHVKDPSQSPVVCTYDLLLRHDTHRAALEPDCIIQIGALPTSKVLRAWLAECDPERWIVDPSDRNLDPLHGRTHRLYCTPAAIADRLPVEPSEPSVYRVAWMQRDRQTRAAIDDLMRASVENTSHPPIAPTIEPILSWLLPQILPRETPIFIANSMPVRDVEYFWPPNDRGIQLWFNRGANGIDGTLSSAIGIAHRNRPTVMLTGDLALLHDTNGFLQARSLVGSLTIVPIDNNGGGIFEMLPVAKFEPPFEEFFATPQSVDFEALCVAYGVEYRAIADPIDLRQQLAALPESGIRLLHVCTDRKHDASWRKRHLNALGAPPSGEIS
ncbi:MAG: 2-succinyl-5-enolpyruvyl-6-hydroxy-3-cyclohexene-1-carboxylic-acid synthase [Geitlerinemataceae cyanobacterium]